MYNDEPYFAALMEAPKEEWAEIYRELKTRGWSDALGKGPDAFSRPSLVRRLLAVIEREIGEKRCQRAVLVEHGKMSDRDFEDWWDSKERRAREAAMSTWKLNEPSRAERAQQAAMLAMVTLTLIVSILALVLR